MLKRRILIMLAVFSLMFAGIAQAQDEEMPTAAEVQETLEHAQNLTDFAFNLLGIFEAVSVAITIVGAALGAFGFARLLSAQNSLTEARTEVEQDVAKIREQFEADRELLRDEFEQLSAELRRAIEEQRREAANSTLATALLSFGERQYKATDYTGAVNTYNRALALDDNNPVTYYRIGYVYTSMGELNEAEDSLLRSLEIDSEFAPAKVALGFVYRRIGEKLQEGIEREQMFNQAERWMLEALRVSPKLVDEDGESWWGALGGLYKRRGQIDQAIYAYEQAAQVTPNSSYPFGNLANLYGQEHNIEAMLRQWRRVERLAAAEVQAEVGNYWGYFDLLTAQLAIGHIEQADALFVTVVESVPADAVYAFGSLVNTLRQLGDLLQEGDYPQYKDMFAFADRVEAHMKEREKDPAAVPLESRPEDTITIDKVTGVADKPEDNLPEADS